MSDMQARISHSAQRWPLRAPRRLHLAAGLAVGIALVIAAAWADGGERALRPIAQQVELPAQGRAGGQD